MIITYFGGEFFKVQFGDKILAFNPISKDSKLKASRFGADIVLVTAHHEDFNGVDQVTHGDKKPFVITGPGEYEVKEVFIKGLPSESKFGAKEKDLDCAFRLVSKRVINSISLTCITGVATTELLAKARKKGFRIKEIGVNHYPRILGKPVFEWEIGLNLPKPNVVLDILREAFKLWFDIRIRGS